MTEENKKENVENTSQENGTPEVDNNAVKNSPLFQKLAQQLADRERADQERADAEAQAAAEANQKALIEQGRFEESLALKTAELESVKEKHSRELLEIQIKNRLYKAGFGNDTFINGAVLGYNPEDGDIDSYVSAIESDESNNPFKTAQVFKPNPPNGTHVSNVSVTTSHEDLKQLSKSDSAEVRAQARAQLRKNFEKTLSF